ncbi:hypothetical protein KQ51_01591 [Candidatus Izimaplasma bacterium HR1]|jgi:uncharacterized membrane protein|uniref:hypothetical protein n=1 Tax=Candidatus Izimoplasma sp. HR1 TaxID=1541959 RepID=UPI0004F7DCFD|nr:hypothetical protein KQ51_01591 [Candidatus Izimaplasma bacterium HR1]
MDRLKRVLNIVFIVSIVLVVLGFILRNAIYPIPGVPANLDSAQELIEDYEVGLYYANSHGTYTVISYEAWRFHTITWNVSVPFIVVGLLAKGSALLLKSQVKEQKSID